MSDDPAEARLRALFRAAREGDESATPAFSRMWLAAQSEARTRAGRRRIRSRALAAAALVAALLYTVQGQWRQPEANLGELTTLAQELESWNAPLDFLLTTPGSELLETTPSFGQGISNDALGMDLEVEERT